jgi:hypothetical protein
MFERAYQNVSVDGVEFEIQPLGAIQGRKLFTKIVKSLGPALSEVAKLAGAKDKKSQDAASALGLSLLGGLLERLDPELVSELCEAFAQHCTVRYPDGTKPKLPRVFDDYFAGRYSHLTRWLIECLRVNFADFLSDGSLMRDLQTIGKPAGSPASETPTQST